MVWSTVPTPVWYSDGWSGWAHDPLTKTEQNDGRTVTCAHLAVRHIARATQIGWLQVAVRRALQDVIRTIVSTFCLGGFAACSSRWLLRQAAYCHNQPKPGRGAEVRYRHAQIFRQAPGSLPLYGGGRWIPQESVLMITTVHLIVDQKHYPELIMKVENDIVNIALHILLKATSKNLLHGRFLWLISSVALPNLEIHTVLLRFGALHLI